MADDFEHGTSAAASTVDDEDGWISAESPDILDWENPDLIPKMQKRHLKDLEAALQADREAVDLTPPEHPDRAGRLQKRYRRLGELKDLEAALHTNQEAVDLTPPEHPNRGNGLTSLAMSFMDHYHRLGDLKDLEAALHLNQTAVDLTALEHPDRAGRLQNLGVSFRHRYQRLKDLKDLEAALCTNQEVVDLTTPDHPDWAGRLQNLATSFGDRYQRFGDLEDLEAALCTNQEAELEAALQADKEAVNLVALTPPEYPDRASQLQNLAASFTHRFQRLGDLKDLEGALQADKEAVSLTPPDHPDRAGRLQSLAASFAHQYQKFSNPKDLEEIHSCYNESFRQPTSRPEHAWWHALHWANFAAEFQPSDCIPAYRAAFNLLSEILWIGNAIPVRQNAIQRLDILETSSEAIKICIDQSDFHAAVEILEQGLAITFQQMLQLKTDTGQLPPPLAKRLLDLSSELYNGSSGNNAISIVEDRKNVLSEIRQQPGLEHFLLPKAYSILCNASKGGPVVILTSHKAHCNAIVSLNPTTDPIHVALVNVTLELIISQQDMLKNLLKDCNIRN
ncbi:hypothetical protein GGX14DRAFT_393565 [Mycena pura]|uniref:TPR-like protein n=1 Tax=Mycena pura TaxID=153505 RepID=A0AAD6YIM4_9AGAR|nr:hypothetical protein GGX14DRAFT_393565 [Mycena pura]